MEVFMLVVESNKYEIVNPGMDMRVRHNKTSTQTKQYLRYRVKGNFIAMSMDVVYPVPLSLSYYDFDIGYYSKCWESARKV